MAAPPSTLKTSVEPLEGNKVRLRVGVPSAEFEKAIDAAFRKLAREVKVPGFRPGKAPRRLLEARFGTEVAREQALRDSLPDFYAQAVEVEDIDVIAAPEIDITAGEDEGDVEFDAVVEIRPVVELQGYDALTVEIPSPAVPDEAVDAQVDALRERFADLEDSAAPLSDGNYAEIDIKGYVHDDVIDALTATDFLYEVGGGTVVPELDTELRGKRPDDILKFNAVLDERFGERSGQEVSFQVLVKAAKRKVLPDADDDWASEASEFDTLEELRGDVRRRLELVGRVQGQMALRDKVLEAVSGLVDIEIPEALVNQEMESRLHDLVHRLEHQGVTIPQYLLATGQDQETFLANVREGATAAVRADLALRAVVAQEAIEASDEELDTEIERLAERVGQKPDKVRRDLGKRGALEAVRSDLARGKALQFLVDHATAVDEDGNPVDLTLPEGEAAAEPAGAAEGEATGAAPADPPADTASPDADTAESPDDQDQQEPQA
jgi:trigger factor